MPLATRPLHTRYTPDPDSIMEKMVDWGRMARDFLQAADE